MWLANWRFRASQCRWRHGPLGRRQRALCERQDEGITDVAVPMECQLLSGDPESVASSVDALDVIEGPARQSCALFPDLVTNFVADFMFCAR